MAGMQVVLLSVCVLVTIFAVQSSAQGTEDVTNPTLRPPPPRPDPLIHNLQFSLPIVIVCIILFIMGVIVVIVMRKARYGQFCCLKPKMRIRYVDEEEGAGETTEGNSNQSPPTYKMTDIAPPAYTDALQDVLVSQQTSKEVQQDADQRDLVEVSLEENEDESDHAPLNP